MYMKKVKCTYSLCADFKVKTQKSNNMSDTTIQYNTIRYVTIRYDTIQYNIQYQFDF